MCGGVVLNENRELVGMIEGIVSNNSISDSLKGVVSYISATQISSWLQEL